jgi:replicative DNA helicase
MTRSQLAAVPGSVSDVLHRLEREGNRPPARVVPTGFDLIDRAIGGLCAQDLVVVAGRPGVGKTITALQWARAAALAGIGVVYVCYEHDQLGLISRLLCLEIGMLDIPTPASEYTERLQVLHDVRVGRWSTTTNAGRHPIVRAARARLDSYADRLFLIAGESAPTASEIDGVLRDHAGDVGLVVVDYMQRVPGARSSVAQELKSLALTHSVAVVALSALNEAGLSVRRARLHDLRDAHEAGYEADVVLLLNDKVSAVAPIHLTFDETNVERFKRFTVFSIEKNRHGIAPIHLEFEKDFATGRFLRPGAHVVEHLVDEIQLGR